MRHLRWLPGDRAVGQWRRIDAADWVLRLERWLPVLFVVYALPLGLALARLTPPFQNPDEPSHFLRAVEIAGGELLGRRFNEHDSGGRVDPAAVRAAAPFDNLRFHPERKLVPAQLIAASVVRWGEPRRDVRFPNTVLYSPVAYLPAAAMVRLGQALDLNVIQTFGLCRMVNVVVAVLLGVAALALWQGGRALVFTVLTLPMSVAMFASVAHDGQLIAGAALALALAMRHESTALALSALLFGVLGAGRPTYAPLALLLLVRRPSDPRRIVAVATAVACIALWSYVISKTRTELHHDDLTIDASAQLAQLLAHPLQIPALLWRTLVTYTPAYVAMVIGILGWLDTALPLRYMLLGTLTLGVALVADALTPAVIVRSGRLLAWLLLLSSCGLLLLSQYLTWNAVGSPVVEGIQGRYLLPMLPTFALCTVGLAGTHPNMRAAALAWCAVFPLLTQIVTPLTVIARYIG